MSYYDELDKVLAMTGDRPAGLIPRKSGIDLPRDSEGERLSLSSDPPKKPRLSAHGTTPNPRHCESDGKGESSGEQKKKKKAAGVKAAGRDAWLSTVRSCVPRSSGSEATSAGIARFFTKD